MSESTAAVNGNATSYSTSEISTKVKDIVRTNGITEKISEVIVKDAGLAGEGFASETKCITVNFENCDKSPLNLFAKAVTINPSHTKMLDEMKAFVKEARFFMEYVPAAEKMCKSKGFEGLVADLYPKCYYGDNKIIVMENLVVDKGYCLLPKTERQDMDASKLALITLAKHHAVSHAMIQEEGGPINFFKRFPDLEFEAFDKPFFATMMGPALMNAVNTDITIIENNDVEDKSEARAFLEEYKGYPVMDLLVASLTPDENEFMVLGHGDYWNNNMMFLKDKETEKVIGHKAIDLQVTRYNAPALDLAYYMFTSVKTDLRQAHLKDLLEVYLNTLKEVASNLGHPISMTYEELFQSYRKKIDIGFWMGMMIIMGRAMEVMKEFDVSKVDIKDWASTFERLMKNWLDANPDYSETIAKEIVKMAKEYKKLSPKYQ